jgi:hypothetical protein
MMLRSWQSNNSYNSSNMYAHLGNSTHLTPLPTAVLLAGLSPAVATTTALQLVFTPCCSSSCCCLTCERIVGPMALMLWLDWVT